MHLLLIGIGIFVHLSGNYEMICLKNPSYLMKLTY